MPWFSGSARGPQVSRVNSPLSDIASTEQPLRLCALLHSPRCNTTDVDIIIYVSFPIVRLRQASSVTLPQRRVRATAGYRISTEGKNLGPA